MIQHFQRLCAGVRQIRVAHNTLIVSNFVSSDIFMRQEGMGSARAINLQILPAEV